MLQDPTIEFHRVETNTGSSGGYAEGIRRSLEHQSEWLWLMDDDAEPQPDALERLLASPPAADPATAALCCAVVHPDGRVDPLHRCRMARFIVPLPASAYEPGRYADVDCASFVGLMLRTSVVRQIGTPRPEFFIAYDDAEWTLRARRRGRLRLIPEARIVHKLTMGGRDETRRSRLWNRVLGLGYSSAPWDGYWKNLYGIRNFIAIKEAQAPLSPLGFAGLTAAYVGKALLYDARPLRAVPWIVRFALKGRRGDFSGPSPAAWTAMVASKRR
jgi:GT2 family glycosyltransferase